MNKLKASFIKEVLLLSRDKAGLAMLFLMPIALVLIMTLLQDSTFKQLTEKQLPILVINHDADTFGLNIVDGLKNAKFFKLHQDNKITKEELIGKIEHGEYLIGIIINKNSTSQIRNSIKQKIQSQYRKFSTQIDYRSIIMVQYRLSKLLWFINDFLTTQHPVLYENDVQRRYTIPS